MQAVALRAEQTPNRNIPHADGRCETESPYCQIGTDLRGYALGLSLHFSGATPAAESLSSSHVTVPSVGRTICAGRAPGKPCTCGS